MHKTRLNISIDQDIADFAKDFASENRTTVSDIITQYFLAVKCRKEGETARKGRFRTHTGRSGIQRST